MVLPFATTDECKASPYATLTGGWPPVLGEDAVSGHFRRKPSTGSRFARRGRRDRQPGPSRLERIQGRQSSLRVIRPDNCRGIPLRPWAPRRHREGSASLDPDHGLQHPPDGGRGSPRPRVPTPRGERRPNREDGPGGPTARGTRRQPGLRCVHGRARGGRHRTEVHCRRRREPRVVCHVSGSRGAEGEGYVLSKATVGIRNCEGPRPYGPGMGGTDYR